MSPQLSQAEQFARSQQQHQSMASREQERRMREDEIRKRQQEKEEEMQRREAYEAEMRRKREEEDALRREQAAASMVRQVIARVRMATPESFDQLRAELESTLAEQIERMGPQCEAVQVEAEKSLLQAQERVDQITENRILEERKALEEESRKREEAVRIDKLAATAATEIADVEKTLETAQEAAKPTTELAEDATPELMLSSAEATEQAWQLVHKACDAASKSLTDRRVEVGQSDVAIFKLREHFVPLFRKLAVCRRATERLVELGRSTKEKANRKAAAIKKEKELRDQFAKYDGDGDGKMNRQEVIAFAKAEYEFDLNDDHLERLFTTLGEDGVVPLDKFQRLRTIVAIARSDHRAREKKAEEEAKEKLRKEEEAKKAELINAQKAEVQKAIDAASEMLKGVTEETGKVQTLAAPLSSSSSDNMSGEELKDLVARSEEALVPCKESLAGVVSKLTELESEKIEEAEVKSFQMREIATLQASAKKLRGDMERIASAALSAKETATRRMHSELEALRNAAVTALRERMVSKSQTSSQLFDEAFGSAESKVTSENFSQLVKSLPGVEVPDSRSESLFLHLTAGQPSIGKDQFVELIRLFYKVVKQSVLGESQSIKSKTLRRLEAGEIVEVVEGPTKDDGVGVIRLRCRAVKDEVEGWVTVTGNQGTVFLEQGGNTMACVKETPMTDGLSVESSKTIRRISRGEVIEVIEFPKKDESMNVMRIKGKAKLDGTTGWVTVMGNQGTTFLEFC